MKKNSIYALMSAIALSGAIGFSSCSSTEDDVSAEVNPGYDPATGEVPVEFSFSISTANTSTTRMSSAATQATAEDAFRGIKDAKLFTFVQNTNGSHLYDPSVAIGKRYDLSQVVNAGQISADNSRRVLEMSLPLNTNTMVFYGKAATGEKEGSLSLENSYGLLDTNAQNTEATKMSDFTISVSRRITNVNDYHKTEKLLAGVLTCIMNTDFSKLTSEDDIVSTAYPDANSDITYPYQHDVDYDNFKNIKWSDYGYTNEGAVNTKSPLTPAKDMAELEVKLAECYRQMVSIQGEKGELRAASGAEILRTITDLWSIINIVRCAGPYTAEEAVAKRLASEIYNNILNFFSASGQPTDGSPLTGVSFVSFNNLKTNFLANTYWPQQGNEDERSGYGLDAVATSDLSKFPGSFGLPDGASHVVFNNTKKMFEYPATFNSSGMGDQNFTVEDYFYSPELIYFGNSPVRVSNKEYRPAQYPETVTAWDTSNSWSADWLSGDDGYVRASTHSVAMQYDINYGTALLQTTVKYGVTVLRDNNHAVQRLKYGETLVSNEKYSEGENEGEYKQEPDKKITVNASSFQLTGLIIGGQCKNVGWNFLPKKVGNPATYEYGFVYDGAIPTSAQSIPATGASQPNYTLVFDNYNAEATTQQDKVYVALELVNNTGEDFYGNFNVVPNGGTFYIIGELDPAGKTAPTWPTYHKLPPYNAQGNSIQTARVFMQDYMTKVTFVIGEKSLQKAYMTVPDLRSTSLTLGLSVNIEWSNGLNFGDVVLGN